MWRCDRREEPYLAFPQQLILGKQMVAAYKYLHARRIAHMDCKSANMVLSHSGDGGQLWLIDMGQAASITAPAQGTILARDWE